MRVLIGASDGVYTCDGDGNTKRVHRGCGPYYGITWNDENVFVFARNALTHLQTTCEVLDHELGQVSTKMLPEVVNVHQAHWQDGVLHVANTNRNRIELFSAGLQPMGHVAWTNKTCDFNHINSVWGRNNMMWVCEHNGGSHSKEEWKFKSKVRVLDVSSDVVVGKKVIGAGFAERNYKKKHVFEFGKGIHNFYREGMYCYTCSSEEESFLRMTPAYEIDGRCELPGWHPRGLAKTKDYFVVGLSACRPRVTRNKTGDGGLAIIDHDMNLVRIIPLPGMMQVNEVRLLDEPDYAHQGP